MPEVFDEAKYRRDMKRMDDERNREEAFLKTLKPMEKLTYETWQNLPEAIQGGGFACTDFHYPELKPTEWSFEFTDFEDKEQVVKVNWEQAVKATTDFVADYLKGKFHFDGMTNPMDPCDYDGYVVYTMVQYAIYGEAIYG